jgi:hypothetical protein
MTRASVVALSTPPSPVRSAGMLSTHAARSAQTKKVERRIAPV